MLHSLCRYGFFNNKRIVLFDTLIKECSEEEVVAVLAHGGLTGTVALSMSVVYILSITFGLCPACSRTEAVQEQDACLRGLLRLGGGWVSAAKGAPSSFGACRNAVYQSRCSWIDETASGLDGQARQLSLHTVIM